MSLLLSFSSSPPLTWNKIIVSLPVPAYLTSQHCVPCSLWQGTLNWKHQNSLVLFCFLFMPCQNGFLHWCKWVWCLGSIGIGGSLKSLSVPAVVLWDYMDAQSGVNFVISANTRWGFLCSLFQHGGRRAVQQDPGERRPSFHWERWNITSLKLKFVKDFFLSSPFLCPLA